jgi:hypothetical protein
VEQDGREDELAGTGNSLVIDGVRDLQITTRPVPALKLPAQRLAPRPCIGPGLTLMQNSSMSPEPDWWSLRQFDSDYDNFMQAAQEQLDASD